MKKFHFLAILSFFSLCVFSQNQGGGWSYKFSGFIDPQLFFDTREVVSAREEQLLFYPAEERLDASGSDINASQSLNMLAITARLGMRITAPDVLNAKVSGYLEGDFTGSSEGGINMLRLRHAYLNLRWTHSEVLLGQYWHPMVAHEVMPGTRPLNMGVPFHPYSRYVQARYAYHLRSWELAATVAFQLDNKATGPEGGATKYLRNSCVPELNMQLFYREERLLLGAMVNFVVLKPRTEVVTADNLIYKTSTLTASWAGSLFGKYEFDKWSLRFQGIYGNNLFEQLLLGGYVESALDPESHKYQYDNFGCATIWADLGYTKGLLRPGIFVGYGKNTDFGREIKKDETVYGRGFNIDYVWRVEPRIGIFPTNYLNFFIEAEYTGVRYGDKINLDNEAYKYDKGYDLGNLRLTLAAVFNF